MKIPSTLAAVALLAGLPAHPAAAQYPAKPIRFIVPFAAGSPPDLVARTVAEPLAAGLKQQLVIDNRPGAAGRIGLEMAARSAGDGHTLTLGTTGTLVLAPNLYADLKYDAVGSFAPISRLISAPFLVVVHPSLPVKSLREFVSLSRSRPGQLHFGSGGNGNPLHVAGEMFKQTTGVDLVHVPYKGAPFAVTDLVTGRIEVMFEQLAAFRAHMKDGRLRFLAVAAASRIPQLPDVPTTAEAGMPGYEISVMFGLLAPRATPENIVSRLNGEVRKALTSNGVHAALSSYGFLPGATSPQEFAALIGGDQVRWGRAIKAAGIRLD